MWKSYYYNDNADINEAASVHDLQSRSKSRHIIRMHK